MSRPFIKSTVNWILITLIVGVCVVILSAKNRLDTLEKSIHSQIGHLHHEQLNEMTQWMDLSKQYPGLIQKETLKQLKLSRLNVIRAIELDEKITATSQFSSKIRALHSIKDSQRSYALHQEDLVTQARLVKDERHATNQHIDRYNAHIQYVQNHLFLHKLITRRKLEQLK